MSAVIAILPQCITNPECCILCHKQTSVNQRHGQSLGGGEKGSRDWRLNEWWIHRMFKAVIRINHTTNSVFHSPISAV